MPKIEGFNLPENWWLSESWPDTKGNHTYRLIDNRSGKPVALCEYEDKPDQEMVQRAVASYVKWSGG